MEKKSIGVGYIAETKNGDKMLRLTIEGTKYVVFSNNYKKNEKQPDMLVYKAFTKESSPPEEQKEPERKRKSKVGLPF